LIMYTTYNHPQKNNIHSTPLENLQTMKPTVEYAVKTWENDTIHSKEEKEYNVNFFTVYLQLVNNQIKKLQK